VLAHQSIDGNEDNVTFTIGTTDRVMTQVANDSSPYWAKVEVRLLRVTAPALLRRIPVAISNNSSDN
jgi:hypothetical protein